MQHDSAAAAARNAPRRRNRGGGGGTVGSIVGNGLSSSSSTSGGATRGDRSTGSSSTGGPGSRSTTTSSPMASNRASGSRTRSYGRSSRQHGGGGSSGSGSVGGGATSGSYLLQAAALQDHFARNLRMQGAGKKVASLQPGADMTLAQRYGLVKRPPALLTTNQWKEVQEKSRAREDSCGECVICREDFKNEDQILLSCSHVFHKQCIDAFERFAKQRCCPLCRTEQYQKRKIEDGRKLYRHKCATKIQSHYKGHMVRKAYKKLRRHIPYKDPRMKRRWLEDRIEEQSSALVKEVEDDRGDLDSFFAELDASVAKSKADMEEAETALLRRRAPPQFGRRSGRAPDSLLLELNPAAGWDPYSERDEPDEDDSSLGRRYELHRHDEDASGDGVISSAAQTETPSSVDWQSVISKATDREFADCPICLGDLHRNGKKGVAYLSCTHCFHVDCIACFEAFEVARGNTTRCPVCRAGYEKKIAS